MLTFVRDDVLQNGVDRDCATRLLTELGFDPTQVESVHFYSDRTVVTGFLEAPSAAALTCTIELLYARSKAVA